MPNEIFPYTDREREKSLICLKKREGGGLENLLGKTWEIDILVCNTQKLPLPLLLSYTTALGAIAASQIECEALQLVTGWPSLVLVLLIFS